MITKSYNFAKVQKWNRYFPIMARVTGKSEKAKVNLFISKHLNSQKTEPS